jgi:hypothetical protein
MPHAILSPQLWFLAEASMEFASKDWTVVYLGPRWTLMRQFVSMKIFGCCKAEGASDFWAFKRLNVHIKMFAERG